MNDIVAPGVADVAAYMQQVGEAARAAARDLARAGTQAKNRALVAIAAAQRPGGAAQLEAKPRHKEV